MEELAGLFRRNLLEKPTGPVLVWPHIQKRVDGNGGVWGGKKPIFESSDLHTEQLNFLFPQQRHKVAVHFHQSSASPSQDPAGIPLGTDFGAREVPAASDLTFSYSATGTGGGEPQKGKAGFETHHLDPDKMKRGK